MQYATVSIKNGIVVYRLLDHLYIDLGSIVNKVIRVQTVIRLSIYSVVFKMNFSNISKVRTIFDEFVLLTILGCWASVPSQQVWFEWWFNGLSKGIHDSHSRLHKDGPSDFISTLGYKRYKKDHNFKKISDVYFLHCLSCISMYNN